MLNQKQIRAAKMYSEGYKPTEIARELEISRSTFYDWMKKGEFTSEVDRFIQEIRTSAEKNMTAKIEDYVQALEEIAFTGRSEKNRTEALTYLLDRVLGKATTKVQDVTEASKDNEQEVTWDSEKDNNILELREASNE